MTLPAFILSEPIAIYPPALHAWIEARKEYAAAFASKPEFKSGEQAAAWQAYFFNQRRGYEVRNGIATIHVNDALSGNLTQRDKETGMTDYGDLIAELEQAAADPQVRGVLLDVNSPGGSAVGAPEAAAAVADLRATKPVVSHIGRLGASAAFYVAAGSNAIVASPSAIVGSIGTIWTLFDLSGLLAHFGVKANILTPEASDLKAAGNPFREMLPKEREFLQSRVEQMNAAFTGWVQKHRPNADKGSMRGQWFSGSEGAENGLVDYVGTKARALGELRSLIG